MYINARSVTRNANPRDQAQARPQPVPSRQGMGYSNQDAPELGAGRQGTTRSCVGNVNAKDESRPRGGQASLGLFGCGSITGRPLRAFAALAAEQVRLGKLNIHRPVPVRPEVTASFLRQMAVASDMREAFPAYHDDEAAECGFSTLCAAELALVQA